MNKVGWLPIAFLGGLVVALSLSAAELNILPGTKTLSTIPLEKRELRWIKSSGLSGYQSAQVAIAVPNGFDPSHEYPVLVTCVTGDPYRSNLEEMDLYWPQAIRRGWVVVTGWADPHPRRDTKAYRRAVTVAAMRQLAQLFPNSKSWPVAVGGFSGGAKNSAIIAAYLQQEGYPLIGLFMGGCNEDMATFAMKKHSPDKSAFRQVPVFLSTGESDTISSIAQSRDVLESMESSGFLNVRLGTYPGKHVLNEDHVSIALDWFKSLSSK